MAISKSVPSQRMKSDTNNIPQISTVNPVRRAQGFSLPTLSQVAHQNSFGLAIANRRKPTNIEDNLRKANGHKLNSRP